MKPSVDLPEASPLRACWMTWAAAGVLPLPVLVASEKPSEAAPVACLYLGLASAWLAAEVFRAGGWPASRGRWRAKQAAVAAGVALNTALFVAMGLAAGVRTNIPFPLMAALCATPAVGLVPWLAVKVRNGYGAILLAAVMLLAGKLAACVVARVVYGPDYIQAGYVAGDWNTAKLMISLFWGQAVGMSVAGAASGFLGFANDSGHDAAREEALAGKPPVAPVSPAAPGRA